MNNHPLYFKQLKENWILEKLMVASKSKELKMKFVWPYCLSYDSFKYILFQYPGKKLPLMYKVYICFAHFTLLNMTGFQMNNQIRTEISI